MTSREREAVVARAVEAGLLDDVLDHYNKVEFKDPREGNVETIRAVRGKLRELLGERPRQVRRLLRVAVESVWTRKGYGQMPDVFESKEWLEMMDDVLGEARP